MFILHATWRIDCRYGLERRTLPRSRTEEGQKGEKSFPTAKNGHIFGEGIGHRHPSFCLDPAQPSFPHLNECLLLSQMPISMALNQRRSAFSGYRHLRRASRLSLLNGKASSLSNLSDVTLTFAEERSFATHPHPLLGSPRSLPANERTNERPRMRAALVRKPKT